MKINFLRKLLFITASALVLCIAPEANASAQGTKDYWSQFRQNYPFHFQSLLISQPSSQGKRTLIISEPPSNFLPDNADQVLQEAFGDMYEGVEAKKHTIGVNGWVRDYVVTLSTPVGATPETIENQITDGIAALSYVLHGTTYKAHALQLPVQESQNVFKAPSNVSISAGEINSWLTDPSQIFISVDNREKASLTKILDNDLSGVFWGKEAGLVLLVIPRSSDLAMQRSDLRKFTLDSDLILGAFVRNNKDSLIIIGRERESTLDEMPPLRTEVILNLADTSKKQLHQSYERRHILAGRINKGKHKDKDWAPIYLSENIINTELGSLLNITDQLLKSWSMAGTVEYANTPYPKPKTYPFGSQPLFNKIGANQLLFNWNTKGLGTVYSFNNYKAMTISRTGSLPITYGSDKNTLGTLEIGNLREFEDEAYNYFSNLKNIHLNRAVQYSTIFQIFHAFPINTPPHKNDIRKKEYGINHVLESFVFKGLKEIENNSATLVAKSRENHFQLLQELKSLGIEEEEEKDLEDFINDVQDDFEVELKEKSQALKSIQEKIGPNALRMIAFFISEPRRLRPLAEEDPKLYIGLEKQFRELGLLVKYTKNIDRFIDQIETTQAHELTSNIKTPSIVISKVASKPKSSLAGGHNLNSEVTKIVADSSIPKGDIRIKSLPDRTVELRVHPEDAANTPSLARVYVRNESQPDLKKRLDQEIAKNQPPRELSKALNTSRAEETPGLSQSEIPGLDIDSSSAINSSQPITKEQLDKIQAFAKEQDLDLYIEQSADGFIIYRGHPPGFSQAKSPTSLVEFLDSGFTPRSGKLHFRNFSEGSVEGIKQTLTSRSSDSDALPTGREALTSNIQEEGSNTTIWQRIFAKENEADEVLIVSRKKQNQEVDAPDKKYTFKPPSRLIDKPNWSQGRITQVNDSGSSLDYQINLPVSQKKPIDLQIKALSNSRWSPRDIEHGQNIIQNTLDDPTTSGKTLEEGILNLRQELKENLQPKNLEFFYKESAGDFTIILQDDSQTDAS